MKDTNAHDNMHFYKKRVRPNDYEHGPVRQFTAEEIAEWEKSDGARLCYQKISQQANMPIEDLKYLDTVKWAQAEESYLDIMEGYSDNG